MGRGPSLETNQPTKHFSKFLCIKIWWGLAPGSSGLRPEHLRVILQPGPGRRVQALQSLTQQVNVMAGSRVPDEIAPFLAGARLHAAEKEDGGLRPIAVGNLLRP